jgi:cobyrinic acid a,c-diamide synthase
MAGLLGHVTSFAQRRMNLGYRRARLLADAPIGRAGTVVRGHEFHYARVLDPGGDAPLAELADGAGAPLGPSGARRGRVTGTFFHAIAGG